MTSFLFKKGTLNGTITVPPSKSYAHRYLIGEALSAEGKVTNIDYSLDIDATISCLESLGVSFIKRFDSIEFLGMNTKNTFPIFNAYESATTLRFFIPISLVYYDHVKFIGTEKLMERGISEYEKSFKDKGIKIIKGKDYIELNGSLKSGVYSLKGDTSSQFISGLLFALPLLCGDSRIDILFEANSFFINGNQSYKACYPRVEGDYSNASFIDAFNYLGSTITLEGLNKTSLQGDIEYSNFFNKLNESYEEIDIKNNIDLGPVLIVFSALKHGAKLTGTRRLKYKESRRDEALAIELKKIGINIIINEDSIDVPKYNGNYEYMEFDSHNDHRVLMSLSLLYSVMDIKINNTECVNKSYPNYFKDLIKLGMNIELEG